MEWTASETLQLVETIAIVMGVAFAASQLWQLRTSRHHEAISELVRSFQTPELIDAMAAVYRMHDDAGLREVYDDRELTGKIHLFGQTMESIGLLVFRRHVPLQIVDDLYGDMLPLCWRKLRPHIRANREVSNNPTAFEWFEWLVDRLTERHEKTGAANRKPAFQQYADWTP